MTKGIIIFGIGSEHYYRMAETLAASLIVNGSREAGIGIALICDDESKIVHRDLFTEFVHARPELYMVDGKMTFNNATVRMYELTPFDVTMKLDADMVWIGNRPIAALFDSLAEVDIAFQNKGNGWDQANSVWAEEDEIKSKYKLTGEEKLYKIYGEFLYFKKSDKIKKYFDRVVKIYREKKVKCRDFANGFFTDELAYQIACMQLDIYPHQDDFTPIFNQFLDTPALSRKPSYELDGYHGYSVGGSALSAFRKQQYDILARHYFAVLKLPNPYQVVNKRSFLPERKKL